MSNYDEATIAALCYNPGIPTDSDLGNISVPELTFDNNYVNFLEFSTFTMDFSVEQLLKKRNGDTFIGEINFIGNPPPDPYVGHLAKKNIKFYYISFYFY